jgi:hypothetical protein
MRLTNSQWQRAVTDVLRLDAPGNLAGGFVGPVLGVAAFDNNERLLHVGGAEFVDFEQGAEAPAALATGTLEALERLHAGTEAAGFVTTVGRRIFRRPLTAQEQTRYEGAFATGEEIYGAGFEKGAAFVIRAMLQSPHFLYRSELGPGSEPLSGLEIASKLSFWLRDTTPTDAELDAAEAGEMESVDQIEALTRQMLEEPDAPPVLQNFHRQLYNLDRLLGITKLVAPDYTEAVAADLSVVTQAFFARVFEGDQGLREILTSPRGFVTPALAPLYGIEPAPDGVQDMDLPASRVGYFMQVPWLLSLGFDQDPNTIYRGLELLFGVLCSNLPPPSGLPPPLPDLQQGQTNRQRIQDLTTPCGAACHADYINPLGFAFEAFDGLGREREVDNGQPVDATGVYPFDGGHAFDGAKELMQLMAEGTQAPTCYAKNLSSYGLQRDIAEADRPLLTELAPVSREESLKELIVSLVLSPAFRVRAESLP